MKPYTLYEYDGKMYTAPELAALAGIGESQMYKRLRTMSPADAVKYVKPVHFSTPPKLYPYHDGELTIREFCTKTGKNYKTVAQKLQSGKTLEEIENEHKERHTNNRTPVTYFWKDRNRTVKEIAEMEEVDLSNLYRRLKQGMSIEDAISEIKKNQFKTFPYEGKMLTRPEILKLNPDVSESRLYLLLSDENEYTEEEVKAILALCPRKEYYKVGDISLFQYCIEKRYNYMPIYYLIKIKGYSVEDAIKEYEEVGQGNPNVVDNTVGNILLNHFCIMEQMSALYILYYLNRGYSLQEAIIRCCFNSQQSYANKKTRLKLCSIYQIWETLLPDDRQALEERYNLSQDDIAFMEACEKRITQALKDYNYLCLAYYLDNAEDDEQLKQILSDKKLSVEEVLEVVKKLYVNFELLDPMKKSPVKYKWHNSDKKTYN